MIIIAAVISPAQNANVLHVQNLFANIQPRHLFILSEKKVRT